MNWTEGQRVECQGIDWGPCYVTLSSQHMVVIYCPRYDLVTTANQSHLEQAGWRVVQQRKVISLQEWVGDRHKSSPVPQS